VPLAGASHAGPGAQSQANRDVKAVNAYTLTIPRYKQFLAAGLTTRDFLLIQAALLQAGLTYGLIKEGTITRESAIKSAKISAANLDFYQQNEAASSFSPGNLRG